MKLADRDPTVSIRECRAKYAHIWTSHVVHLQTSGEFRKGFPADSKWWARTRLRKTARSMLSLKSTPSLNSSPSSGFRMASPAICVGCGAKGGVRPNESHLLCHIS